MFEEKEIYSTDVFIEIKRKKIKVFDKIKRWLSD